MEVSKIDWLTIWTENKHSQIKSNETQNRVDKGRSSLEENSFNRLTCVNTWEALSCLMESVQKELRVILHCVQLVQLEV